MPLYLLAEGVLGPRLDDAAQHFVGAHIVLLKDYESFDRAVSKSITLRDSAIAEIVLAVAAYLMAVTGFFGSAVHLSTWYRIRFENVSSLTPAG